MTNNVNIEALINEAKRELFSGRKDLATILLIRVTELDERNEMAWLWLSAAVDTLEEAKTCIDNVLILNPQNEIARQISVKLSVNEAKQSYFKSFDVAPSATSNASDSLVINRDERLRVAKREIQNGNFEAAQEMLFAIIEVNERDDEAWLWLAATVDTNEQRLICFDNVLTIDPNNREARKIRDVLVGHPQAENPTPKAAPPPKISEAKQNLARGQTQRAAQILRELLATDENSSEAWLWLAAAVETNAERYECLTRVLEIDPDNDFAQRLLDALPHPANADEAEVESPDPADRWQYYVEHAVENYVKGKRLESLRMLSEALDRNADLVHKAATARLAGAITNMPSALVINDLLEPKRREALLAHFEPPPDNPFGRILHNMRRIPLWKYAAVFAGIVAVGIWGSLVFRQGATLVLSLVWLTSLSLILPLLFATRPTGNRTFYLTSSLYLLPVGLFTWVFRDQPVVHLVAIMLLTNTLAIYYFLLNRREAAEQNSLIHAGHGFVVIIVSLLMISIALTDGIPQPLDLPVLRLPRIGFPQLDFSWFIGLFALIGALWSAFIQLPIWIMVSITVYGWLATTTLLAMFYYPFQGRFNRDLIEERLVNERESGGFSLGIDEYDEADEVQLSIRDQLVERMEDAVSERMWTKSLYPRLRRANLSLSVAEFVALHPVTGLATFALLNFVLFRGNLTVAFLGGVVGFFVPTIVVNLLAQSRLSAFNSQLPDALRAWTSLLRSGQSVVTAMEEIQRNFSRPISTEFRRVVQASQIGVEFTDALDNMYGRMPSNDLLTTISAIQVQGEVGGNLANVIEIITDDISKRDNTLREARVGLQPFYRLMYGILAFLISVTPLLFPGSAIADLSIQQLSLILLSIVLLSLAVLISSTAMHGLRRQFRMFQGAEQISRFWILDIGLIAGTLFVQYLLNTPVLGILYTLLIGVSMVAPYPIVTAIALAIPAIWSYFSEIQSIILTSFGGITDVEVNLLPPIFVSTYQNLDDLITTQLLNIFPNLAYFPQFGPALPPSGSSLPPSDEISLLPWVLLVIATPVVIALINVGIREDEGYDPLQDRLAEFGDRESPTSLDDVENSMSFLNRVAYPLLRSVYYLGVSISPSGQLYRTEQQLLRGGPYVHIRPDIFLFIQIFLSISLALLGAIALAYVAPPDNGGLVFAGAIVFLFVGYSIPPLWLRYQQKLFQDQVMKELSSVLQIMRISLEAGLGLDAALGKVYEKLDGSLPIIIGRAIREIQLGKGRRETLFDLANRINLPVFRRFVSLLISSDQSRSSIGEMIAVQSDQLYVMSLSQLKARLARHQFQVNISLYFLLLPSVVVWLGAVLG